MTKEWDRTDYLEEDVRRHSDELRQLTKITHENTAALGQLIGEVSRINNSLSQELDRRQTVMEKHETRIRDLEGWKSRSGAYWAIVGTFAGAAAALLVRQLGQGVFP
jgi:predicted RNase H-like nuclease (RuvC/YqgF family)